MRILACLLSLYLAHVALAAEDPTALVELRQAWEKQRTEAQANVGKLYLEELEQLKKNFTKAGNVADGMAVHNEIEGGKQGEKEPVLLTKARQARDKSLEKALTPLDKRYWRSLKKLKEDFQGQGNLAGVIAADAEIEKLVAEHGKQKYMPPKKIQAPQNKTSTLDGAWIVHYENGGSLFVFKGDRAMNQAGHELKWEYEKDSIVIKWLDGSYHKIKPSPDDPNVMEGYRSVCGKKLVYKRVKWDW